MSDEPTTESTAEPTGQPEPAAAPTQEPASMEKFGQFIDQYAPEEYKDAKTWEKFRDTDPATALKSIVDMDKYIGKKGDIPPEDATDEQKAEFAKKLNAEMSAFAEGEDLELPEGFGDKASEMQTFYKDYVSDFIEAAREKFMQNPTFDSIIQAAKEYALKDAASSVESHTEAARLTQERLEGDAKKMGITTETLRRGIDELVARDGSDMSFNELAYKYYQATTNGNTPKDALTSTPAGKQARMSEILADNDYWNKTSENAARHEKLVAEYKRLFDEGNESS